MGGEGREEEEDKDQAACCLTEQQSRRREKRGIRGVTEEELYLLCILCLSSSPNLSLMFFLLE